MRLFDTLTQQQREFRPLGESATLYVCGITPYDTTHLGHAFLNVVYDTLVRYLRWSGQPVRYVQNVTDIDDDILRQAGKVGKPWDVLGREETEKYLADLRALNVALPDEYVRASDQIERIIQLTEALLARGNAYVNDGWVYFSVASDPGFGRLAEAAGYLGYANWLKTANERGNTPTDPRKRDPLDFVLWQGQQAVDEPAWPSPWGPGRPGWHIECSAMATRYLGPRIDLHGGGADLIFPHHTCEIAQSENATGARPFVNFWLHIAMVRQDGEKMSKSLGNLTRVSELLPTYSADAVRLLLLSHHYREAWEYTPDQMVTSARRAQCLAQAAASAPLSVGAAGVDAPARMTSAAATAARTAFVAALDDDLDTPGALSALEVLASAIEQGEAPDGAATLRELAGVLGLRLGTPSGTAHEPEHDAADRTAADPVTARCED